MQKEEQQQRRRLVLALALGARVGVAVVAKRHVPVGHILNLRKLPSLMGQEQKFRSRVAKLVESYAVDEVVLVRPPDPTSERELVKRELTWAAEQARGLPVRVFNADQIREQLVPSTMKRTNRSLAMVVVTRYPALAIRTVGRESRVRELIGRGCDPPVRKSDRERYWSRLFLAVAGAHATLTHPDPRRRCPTPTRKTDSSA